VQAERQGDVLAVHEHQGGRVDEMDVGLLLFSTLRDALTRLREITDPYA
jgi:hypothetical protein